MQQTNEKQLAAEASVDYLEDGMIVGLGSGSTVVFMLHKLSKRIKEGLNITAISTSTATSKLARALGINILEISDVNEIDITIDGADEVDENLNGIKGGGGALLHEKIVASISKMNIWIVDSTKLVKTLGIFPLPIEVVQFGSSHLLQKFEESGYKPSFRIKDRKRYLTDNNNYIIDLRPGKIENPAGLDIKIKSYPGVVETGLFYDVADIVLAGIGQEIKIFDKKKRVRPHN